MLTEENIEQLARFMGWHLAEEYVEEEYIPVWVNEAGDYSIPIDWWNPDTDMTDAWMLVERTKELGIDRMNELEGWISLIALGDKGGEIQMRASIFDLTPEIICTSIIKLTGL